MNESSPKKGIVYLVGAGPGDPELITVKAGRLLDSCDVVIYDNLVPDELIATLPDRIERQYVGKKADRHTLSQEKINALLVELAGEGKTVVRLKGGDPFIFGRGGEEAQFLKEHGIPFEVVPGVTAGVAAPALVGIPCTDRRKATTVTFVTGHKATGDGFPEVSWDWIGHARAGTIVIYMGVSEIENIVQKLLDAGMAAETPSAAIERASFPTQRIVCAPLSELPRRVREEQIQPPAMFVIGETVTLHETLNWIEDRPLLGARILVTRPADQARPLYRSLRALGAEVQPFPTIATADVLDEAGWSALDRLTAGKRWLVFTSENGVRYFLKQWRARGHDIRSLSDFRIASIGEGAADALKARMMSPEFVPAEAAASSLAKQMIAALDLAGATVVRIRGSSGDSIVEETFTQAGVQVVPLEVYRTVPQTWSEDVKEKVLAYPPDVVWFSSGPAVAGFCANLPDAERQQTVTEAAIVSVGPSVSKEIRDRGMTVALEARARTVTGMIEELAQFWRARAAAR